MIAAVTTVLRARRRPARDMAGGRVWCLAGSFRALVWDPTALHEVIQRTKRNPILAMLAKREGG